LTFSPGVPSSAVSLLKSGIVVWDFGFVEHTSRFGCAVGAIDSVERLNPSPLFQYGVDGLVRISISGNVTGVGALDDGSVVAVEALEDEGVRQAGHGVKNLIFYFNVFLRSAC
jgi:hypothetical protein